MLEKITQLAEATATRVSLSRRGFLGRARQGALALGALLAGFANPAGAGQTGVVCCTYRCDAKPYKGHVSFVICQATGPCASSYGNGGCHLTSHRIAGDCTQC